MTYTRETPEAFFQALEAVSWDGSRLFFEGDLVFTSEAEHLEWLIEVGAACGGCQHPSEDHQPVGDGWSVCTSCAVPSVLPSGWAVGCAWRYGCGACVTDYLKAAEQGIESPDAYRYIPE